MPPAFLAGSLKSGQNGDSTRCLTTDSSYEWDNFPVQWCTQRTRSDILYGRCLLSLCAHENIHRCAMHFGIQWHLQVMRERDWACTRPKDAVRCPWQLRTLPDYLWDVTWPILIPTLHAFSSSQSSQNVNFLVSLTCLRGWLFVFVCLFVVCLVWFGLVFTCVLCVCVCVFTLHRK